MMTELWKRFKTKEKNLNKGDVVVFHEYFNACMHAYSEYLKKNCI